jgi:hypothetical protein
MLNEVTIYKFWEGDFGRKLGLVYWIYFRQ